MSAFRRPKLTHMPHQEAARVEAEQARLADLSQRDDHICVGCGVFGAFLGFKPSGWAHVRDEAVWACGDAECQATAKAKVTDQHQQRSAA